MNLDALGAQTVKARAVLLEYCTSLPAPVFLAAEPEYGQGSMGDTLAHVAHCYGAWTGRVCLNAPLPAVEPADLPDVAAITVRFAQVDALVWRAIREFTGLDAPFDWTAPSG